MTIPFEDLIAAAEPDGTTVVISRPSAIVFAYALWEDRFRSSIARECGLSKNELKSDVFRDLNKYRQAILHGGSKLRIEPRVIRAFRKGEELLLKDENMTDIFRASVDELNRIGEVHWRLNPRFDFEKPLNS